MPKHTEMKSREATQSSFDKKNRRWKSEEVKILVEMYQDHFASEIAEILGRKVRSVYNKARMLGLHSSPGHQALAGKIGATHPKSIASRFKAGHIPQNKGKKMSEETRRKVERTMFRKGNIPVNHKPVGTEQLRGDGYIWVKVGEPNKWKQKQRVVWEKANGNIPIGYNVQFRNKDRQDFRIENLYIISRADQMRNENSLIASYPKQLADIIRLTGFVRRQINKHERKYGTH